MDPSQAAMMQQPAIHHHGSSAPKTCDNHQHNPAGSETQQQQHHRHHKSGGGDNGPDAADPPNVGAGDGGGENGEVGEGVEPEDSRDFNITNHVAAAALSGNSPSHTPGIPPRSRPFLLPVFHARLDSVDIPVTLERLHCNSNSLSSAY
ncbi:hypothetical protein DFH06DRAFT_1129862 [Mycena polygramma]|nr:hypothetical protein DFH06DRAFT_1129862 [Mycena polygramma]